MVLRQTSLQETAYSVCSVSWGCTWCLEFCSCSWWRESLSTVRKRRPKNLSHRCTEIQMSSHREALDVSNVVVLFSGNNDYWLCSARRLRSGRWNSTAIRDSDGGRHKAGVAFNRPPGGWQRSLPGRR